MAIYVDPCVWPARDRVWCHLMTDGPSSELRAFAEQLGLRPEWIQRAGTPREHFDLPPEGRQRAIELGAIPVTAKEMIRLCVRQHLADRES